MEYRAFILVPGLPLDREDLWEPVIDHLEGAAADYGPVIGWIGDCAQFVLATDAPSETAAARELFAAVADALAAVGPAHAYPSAIDIEPAGQALAAA